jgi:hypothetical protein
MGTFCCVSVSKRAKNWLVALLVFMSAGSIIFLFGGIIYGVNIDDLRLVRKSMRVENLAIYDGVCGCGEDSPCTACYRFYLNVSYLISHEDFKLFEDPWDDLPMNATVAPHVHSDIPALPSEENGEVRVVSTYVNESYSTPGQSASSLQTKITSLFRQGNFYDFWYNPTKPSEVSMKPPGKAASDGFLAMIFGVVCIGVGLILFGIILIVSKIKDRRFWKAHDLKQVEEAKKKQAALAEKVPAKVEEVQKLDRPIEKLAATEAKSKSVSSSSSSKSKSEAVTGEESDSGASPSRDSPQIPTY